MAILGYSAKKQTLSWAYPKIQHTCDIMSHKYVSKRQNEVNKPQKSDMEIKTDQTLPYPKTGQILYPKYDESSILIKGSWEAILPCYGQIEF